MKLTVSEVSKKFGVSVRTLRYYDEIGLVKPSEIAPNGYRFYDEEALLLLQQVLFYRELELPLKEIAALMHHPDYDKKQALEAHRDFLLLKRKHIDDLLCLLDETIGGTIMEKERTTAQDVAAAKDAYAEEARTRYGNSPQWQQYEKRAPRGKAAYAAKAEAQEIFCAFAALAEESVSPTSEAAQALVLKWQAHITENYYDCTDAILSGLAELYLADERFFKNLEQHGKGTAQMMHDAIKAHCAKH